MIIKYIFSNNINKIKWKKTHFIQTIILAKISLGASLSVKVSTILPFLNPFYTLGAFGNVIYAWIKKDKKKKFAIKAMKKHDIISSKHVDHIENEKKILELIQHPFIVSLPTFNSY